MIPTLAARSRQQRLQDLARAHGHPPSQVAPEPPVALQGYLQQLAAAEPETLVAAEPETPPAPEPAAEPMLTPKARSPQPAGLELLLWLALLLIDGLLALGDLLAPHRSGMPASRAAGSTAEPSGPGVVRWMGGALNPAPLA